MMGIICALLSAELRWHSYIKKLLPQREQILSYKSIIPGTGADEPLESRLACLFHSHFSSFHAKFQTMPVQVA